MNGLVAKGFHEHPDDHAYWSDGYDADGPFDCVNKPRYGCQEQVTIAGSSCSLCHVSTNERPLTHNYLRPLPI